MIQGTLRSRTRRFLGRGDRAKAWNEGDVVSAGNLSQLRFATRWGQYQYINPYEGFAKKQKMASFQKIQELLLPSLEEEIIDDEEFSVLYQAYAPPNFQFQHSAYEKFSLKK